MQKIKIIQISIYKQKTTDITNLCNGKLLDASPKFLVSSLAIVEQAEHKQDQVMHTNTKNVHANIQKTLIKFTQKNTVSKNL